MNSSATGPARGVEGDSCDDDTDVRSGSDSSLRRFGVEGGNVPPEGMMKREVAETGRRMARCEVYFGRMKEEGKMLWETLG